MFFPNIIQILPTITFSTIGSITYSGRELRKVCTRVEHDNTLKLMNIGAIKDTWKLRLNRKNSRKCTKGSKYIWNNGVRFQNLHYVEITDTDEMEVLPYITLGTLNSRSINNEAHIIIEELEDKNVDIVLITETWLKIWMKIQHG